VELSETESACADCGLGRRRGTLRVSRSSRTSADRAQFDADAEGRLLDAQHVFTSAAFLPCGLDDQWRGLRWFGGHGSADGHGTRLELAHGDAPWDSSESQVRVGVETVRPVTGRPETDRFVHLHLAARTLIQHFWHTTGVLSDSVRRAAFPSDGQAADALAPWEHVPLTIDGGSVEFRVLAHDQYWVALAERPELIISVQATRWPLDKTALVTVADFGRYVTGARQLRERWPR
jgi:hypothetical protein